MFARIRLERLADAFSSRYVVTRRELLWQSPVLLTPYLDGNRIDASALVAFVGDCERAAGLSFGEVDTGAVVLTGTALARANARAVADAIAADTGRLVCAAAGHHLEAELAAARSPRAARRSFASTAARSGPGTRTC